MTKILKIKNKYEKKLLKKKNVVGVGIGKKIRYGEEIDITCIRVYVEKKVPIVFLKKKDLVPETIKTEVTDVIEIGRVVALGRTEKQRPCPGGMSIGHYKVSAGTFGCIVIQNTLRYILSNNHVLANCNDAEIFDKIVQPGIYDGGTVPDDVIAYLSEFIFIEFGLDGNRLVKCIAKFFNFWLWLGGSKCRLKDARILEYNTVDCAIARPFNDGDVLEEILDIGIPIGIADAEIGLEVKKSGRTTGLTHGIIDDVNATITVNYGGGRYALFKDQIIIKAKTGSFSAGGDSGSVIVKENENRVVGLLFAGSQIFTVANKINNVLSKFNGEIKEPESI
jgi:hypothetical protein